MVVGSRCKNTNDLAIPEKYPSGEKKPANPFFYYFWLNSNLNTMKRFLQITAVLACSLMVSGILTAQHYVPLESLDKNAILEEFTGVKCPNCPAGHQTLAQILATYPDRVFAVAYHPFNSSYTLPYPGDPDFRRHYADALYTIPYCGTSRYMPSAFVHRRLWAPPERLTGRTEWMGHCETIMAEPSPMNVGMATSFDEISNTLTVVVDIYYTEEYTGDHSLMVTLAENNLVSNQSGGTYPYTHKHTFREAFVGQWGDPIVTDGAAGTFYTRVFTFQNDSNYLMENCELLAFVLDNTTEVITGIGCAVGDTTYITPDVTLTADTLWFENSQQCLTGQIATLKNLTEADLVLLDVQQFSLPGSPILWQVDPWPFPGFPYTLVPGDSVNLNVIIDLPVDKSKSGFLYDLLQIVSVVDTQFVTIAVNEGLYTSVNNPESEKSSRLSANYPNPFTTFTNIEYTLFDDSEVSVEVFSIHGEKVKELVNDKQKAGTYQVTWNGTDDTGKQLPGGVYVYRLKTSGAAISRRCVILR
jgi:hypothetical protein